MGSILDIEVSCFVNYDTPANPKPVNLLTWLKSDKHFEKQKTIMSINIKAERDKLKAELPAITPSGIFTYRAMKNLVKHTGFIQFDIDKKGNEHIENYNELKTLISNISNVAYCGLSVSGTGYWGLIPIAYPDKHFLHFQFCFTAFEKFGINIDPAPKSISSLRGYAYDPEAYFNHNATILNRYEEPVKKYPAITSKFKTTNKIDVAIKMIHQAPDGEKHNILFKAARLIGGYIITGVVNEDDAIIALEEAIQNRNINSLDAAKKTILDGIKMGKNSPID